MNPFTCTRCWYTVPDFHGILILLVDMLVDMFRGCIPRRIENHKAQIAVAWWLRRDKNDNSATSLIEIS
jgi:hypothetical protein